MKFLSNVKVFLKNAKNKRWFRIVAVACLAVCVILLFCFLFVLIRGLILSPIERIRAAFTAVEQESAIYVKGTQVYDSRSGRFEVKRVENIWLHGEDFLSLEEVDNSTYVALQIGEHCFEKRSNESSIKKVSALPGQVIFQGLDDIAIKEDTIRWLPGPLGDTIIFEEDYHGQNCTLSLQTSKYELTFGLDGRLCSVRHVFATYNGWTTEDDNVHSMTTREQKIFYISEETAKEKIEEYYDEVLPQHIKD